MRPGEVCAMRACDIDTTSDPWTYKPAHHKTEHHDIKRVILLGPRAQKIVEEFWKPDLKAYLFSPADAMIEMRQELSGNRKTPLNQGNKPKANLERRVNRRYGAKYRTSAYDHAIAKACEKAFGIPDEIKEPTTLAAKEAETKLPLEQQRQRRLEREQARKTWRAQHVWSPNQLRHNAATKLRRQYGIDVAQTVLGHKIGSSITEIYAEANVEKAKGVMAKIG
jgi:integrase